MPNLVGMTMKELERCAIEQTYSALGTVEATAEALGLSERTLYSRLRSYRREGGSPVSVTAAPTATAPETAALRVLLAEDDDDLRAALQSFLMNEGYDVVAVADGRAALQHLGRVQQRHAGTPDVLVTDVRMPRANGLELLEGVRALGLELPVIVMSAFGDAGTRERAVELGATEFLDKPIAIPVLQRVLARLSQ
jgi:DNA-binding NtrC family response regulator